jgi:hypothetical protein
MKTLVLAGTRTFLLPEGQSVPPGEDRAQTPEGHAVHVDLAALEPFEVPVAEALAEQEARLVAALQKLGRLGDVLGKLSAGLSPVQVGVSFEGAQRAQAEERLLTIEAELRRAAKTGPAET